MITTDFNSGPIRNSCPNPILLMHIPCQNGLE